MNPQSGFNQEANRGTRTPDPRITNALLYQLSHIGIMQINQSLTACDLFTLTQVAK